MGVQPDRPPGRVRVLIRPDGAIELTPLADAAPTIHVERLADLHAAFVRVRAIVLRPRLRPFVTALADALAATLKR